MDAAGKAAADSVKDSAAAPRAMGSPEEAYRQVLTCLGQGSERRVLDAPAGRGALTRLLVDRGYQVSACDIVPEIFEVEEVECLRGDLNERLPYGDAAFDAVTSCNGIHRVHFLGRAISEYARILRPGGRLLVTLPNFVKLDRRLRFLLSGVVSWAATRSAAVTDEPEGRYRHAVSLSEILLALEASGLKFRSLQGLSEGRGVGRILLAPVVLAFRCALGLMPRRKRRKYFLAETATYPALFSDFILVEAQKPIEAPRSGEVPRSG